MGIGVNPLKAKLKNERRINGLGKDLIWKTFCISFVEVSLRF